MKKILRNIYWWFKQKVGDDDYWPRQAALDSGVVVGTIACPNCGGVDHGALGRPFCLFCGTEYFYGSRDATVTMETLQDYIDEFGNDVDIDVVKSEIREAILQLKSLY